MHEQHKKLLCRHYRWFTPDCCMRLRLGSELSFQRAHLRNVSLLRTCLLHITWKEESLNQLTDSNPVLLCMDVCHNWLRKPACLLVDLILRRLVGMYKSRVLNTFHIQLKKKILLCLGGLKYWTIVLDVEHTTVQIQCSRLPLIWYSMIRNAWRSGTTMENNR